MKICFLILLCSFCFVGHTQVEYNKKKTWNYPLIKPDTVIEDFYGSKIIDPYRNLENLEDSLVKNWYMNQKQFYDSILLNISNRDSLEKKLNNLKKQRKYWAEIPRMVDKKLFFSRYCYETETYCLDYMNSISDTIHTLFSLDSMNKADNVKYRLDYFEPSHDGNLIAIALSAQGKENSSIYILNVKNKVLLPDIIQNAMGGNPQWLPDNSGFFYQQYIKNNNPDGSKKRKKCVNIHHIGKSPKDDKEIFSKEVSKQIEVHEIDFPLIFLSQSSNNVLGALNHGTEGYSTLYYASLDDVLNSSPEKINWQQIFQHQDLVTNYYLKDDNIFYLSFKNNPKGQIIKKNLNDTSKTRILFESKKNVINDLIFNNNSLFISFFEKGNYRLIRIEPDNGKITHIRLPFTGSGSIRLRPTFEVSDFFQNSDDLCFKFESWNRDQCIMYYYGNSNKVTLTNLMIQDSNNKPENIKIELVDVPSYDGTLVPMTIFYNSDIKLNGNNPLIIEAYGCYGYTYSPRYNPVRNIWLNRGGIFAIAHVRGGGEKGEEWYRAGYKATKPNTWKDLICCSEYLIEKGYTSSKKLAVIGTSCGAIAAGRAITERPDLFKAAVISIGSLNNLRHEEGKTNSNIAEYGSIGDSLGFRYLFEMDVYHHIQDSVKYPSFLFSSGMNDPRLSPWQTGKVVAKLQEISKEYDNIILYHISDEGHSRFSESSDSFSFLFWQLGYPEFKLNFNKFNNKK